MLNDEPEYLATTETGVKLYKTDHTKLLQKWAKEKKVPVVAVLAVHENGFREYALINLQTQDWEYTNTNFEQVAAHIDIMALQEYFSSNAND